MSGRQYSFQDILNGLGDVSNDSLAPETGANADPSQNILLNSFAQTADTITTVDSFSLPAGATPVITWDNAKWSLYQWS